VSIPNTVKEALESEFSEQWKEAIQSEYDSLKEHGTFKVTMKEKGTQEITTKFVFDIKTDADGFITRFKARLVARGFTQQKGVNYEETFAPVPRLTSIRIMFAMAAIRNWSMRQYDVKTAFLHGEMDVELYAKVPQEYNMFNGTNLDDTHTLLMLMGLYGTKQAARIWSAKFKLKAKAVGMIQLRSDSCIYKITGKDWIGYLVVWVDDLLTFTTNQEKMDELIDKFRDELNLQDLGIPKHAIGIKIEICKEGIGLTQQKYIQEKAEEFKIEDSKEQAIPMSSGSVFVKEDETPDLPYQNIIGAIGYAVTVTRPDCAYANGILRRYQNCYGRDHWEAAKTILKYLYSTRNKGLFYARSAVTTITAYVDASYADDKEDLKSTQGYVVYLGDGAIAWKSTKQKTISLSTCEAEYMALGEVTKEIIWIRSLLYELDEGQTLPTKVYCDNQAAIAITKNPQHHERTKHIDIRYHFIRNELEMNTIDFEYIPTGRNVADIMTKALDRKLFTKHADKMIRTGWSVDSISSKSVKESE
jgi:transcription termination factor NusB